MKIIRDEAFYERLDKLSDKIDLYGDIYHDKLTAVVNSITLMLDHINKVILNNLSVISEFLMTHYKKVRYITMPLHWIWIYLWDYFDKFEYNNEVLNEIGVHYIHALAGHGKSTLLWQKMYDYSVMTGKCSYVTTKMEKLKYDELGAPYLNHFYFDIHEFFGIKDKNQKFGQQLKRFDKKQASALVFDEIHYLNNNRNNRSSEYNHTFIPMISSFVTQRHFGINWILVASQMPRNDNQIMNILTSYNKIKIKKGFVYKKWLADGKFTRSIKGWKIKTFRVSADNDYLKLESQKNWFKHATVDFEDFETLNMKDILNDIPMDRRAVL